MKPAAPCRPGADAAGRGQAAGLIGPAIELGEGKDIQEADYLPYEARSECKHEYLRGRVWAMSGGTKDHFDIAFNMVSALKAHLRGRPCRAYGSDVRVRVEEADAYFYPDAHVTCDELDRADPIESRRPSVLVEVKSPSTERFDQGAKFEECARLPSLREYVPLDTTVRRAEVFSGVADGAWRFVASGAEGSVQIDSIGLVMPFADLYSGTEVPERDARVVPLRERG